MAEVVITEADRRAAEEFMREDVARRYSRARVLSDFERSVAEEAAAIGEYAKERDTRTFCVLVGSFLEDTFKAAFVEHWKIEKKQADTFFGANGPLSTFSQRLTVAAGVKWLAPPLQKSAMLVRKIRNEMAHNHRIHLLTQEPILSWANDLTPVERTWLKTPKYARGHNKADLETKLRVRLFSQAMLILSSTLSNARRVAEVLPIGYSEGGWDGLCDVEKELLDVTIKHAYSAFDVRREAMVKLG